MAVKEPAAASRKALRWEEHKQRTRRELLDSARKLFAERGFHATSAADIAAAAGVTERTLFRYFPTKVALVFDEVAAVLPEMLQVIRERPAEEAPYRAVCDCEPGMVNVLSSWPPASFAPTPAVASRISQIATTSHLWAKHARPIRYSTPDI